MRSIRTLAAVLVVFAVLAAACGDDGVVLGGGIEPPETSEVPVTAGSSTTSTTLPPTTTTLATTTTSSTTTTTPTTTTTTTTTTTIPVLPPGTEYTKYELLVDDSGFLEVSVPIEWSDRNGRYWERDDEEFGIAVSASTDIAAFVDGWATPGVFIGATNRFDQTLNDILNETSFASSCTFDARIDYDDGIYRGRIETWLDCGDPGSQFIQMAARHHDGGPKLLIQMIAVTEADLEAVDKVLETFQLTGDPEI